eukprot:Tbor_TRINITY_DN2601_c0_g1::TRINITY_DN2601_c0_g1_i1::g.17930::m.17930/K00599/METTL6; methyltransferase-like protein 6
MNEFDLPSCRKSLRLDDSLPNCKNYKTNSPNFGAKGTPFTTEYFPYTKHQLATAARRQTCKNFVRSWDTYYTNNTVNGYKDRHYILREFRELCEALESKTENELVTWIEIGCGVGNAIIPAIERFPDKLRISGFDISQTAIRLFKKRVHQTPLIEKCIGSLCAHDLAEEDPPAEFTKDPAMFGSVIFVLSAVDPLRHKEFVARARSLVAVGGVVFFRDYCQEDMAQKRFSERRQLSDHTFVRTNGTLSHFFSEEEVRNLFEGNGFKVRDITVIERDVENRKQHNIMSRRWIQARLERLS